jgi:ATP/maltotriose-dependent transcriptional regulator MalT
VGGTNESGRTAKGSRFASATWAGVVDELLGLDADGGLGASDLELLGTSAYLCGREELSEDSWTRAHQLAIRDEDWSCAARVAFWAWFAKASSGQMAVASGWLARGRRLLDDHDPDGQLSEQGWFHIPAGLRAHHSGEFAAARAAFGAALAIAVRHGDVSLAAVARQAEGRSLIGLGDIEDGVELLDEAMLAVLADEVSPIPAGIVYCSVIEACQELLDVARASEWTEALTRWCDETPDPVPFRGRCSIHRSEIRLLQGDLDAALAEVHAACARLADPFHNALGAAYYQLGEVHRARRDLPAAKDAYELAAKFGAVTEPGVSLLYLIQGDVAAARRSIAPVTDGQDFGIGDLDLLAAAVEVAIAGGDHAEILKAANRLADVSALVGAPLAVARGHHWQGAAALAVGDAESAVAESQIALTSWSHIDVPMERDASVALLRQAEGRLAGGPGATDARRPLGLSRREIEVLIEVAHGATNRQVADALFIAERTVARHMSNIFTKLGVSSRTAAAAIAHGHGLANTKE